MYQVNRLVYHPEAGSCVQPPGHNIVRLNFKSRYEGTLPLQGGQRRFQQAPANTLLPRRWPDCQVVYQLHRPAGTQRAD